MITIEGRLCDVGTMEINDDLSAGITVDVNGHFVTLAGITETECKLLAGLYSERVRITVEKCDD